MNKLQSKVERLNSQLLHTESENRRLNTALSTLSSELEKRTAEKESLQRARDADKEIITNNSVKSVNVVEMLADETAPLIEQHVLQTEQLHMIESNLATGEGLVTGQNILQKWALENEALYSATIQLEELQRKLTVSERLESDVATSKPGLEKVTKEEELVTRLEAATEELLGCKKRIAETELHVAELGRYAQVLNVEKITLMGQLELLRGELDKQKETARIAQIGANKVSASLLTLELLIYGV